MQYGYFTLHQHQQQLHHLSGVHPGSFLNVDRFNLKWQRTDTRHIRIILTMTTLCINCKDIIVWEYSKWQHECWRCEVSKGKIICNNLIIHDSCCYMLCTKGELDVNGRRRVRWMHTFFISLSLSLGVCLKYYLFQQQQKNPPHHRHHVHAYMQSSS